MGNIISVHIPQENVNDETVKIIQWLVADGATVQADQPLVEVETSKSTFEIQSPATGVIQRVVAEGLEVPVGDVLCYIGESLAAIEAFRTSQTARLAPTSAPVAAPLREPEPGTTEIPLAAVPPPCRGSRISRAALELIRSTGLNEDDFSARGLVRQSDVPRPLRPGDSGSLRGSSSGRARAARGCRGPGPQRAVAADQAIRGPTALLEPTPCHPQCGDRGRSNSRTG